jgi:hypothetical protein
MGMGALKAGSCSDKDLMISAVRLLVVTAREKHDSIPPSPPFGLFSQHRRSELSVSERSVFGFLPAWTVHSSSIVGLVTAEVKSASLGTYVQ